MKKKLMSLSIFLVLPFVLFGCGKKKTTKKETTKVITTQEHVHEYGAWKTIVSPTCAEEGYKKRTCACGVEEFEIIEKKPHTYIDDKCSICGHEQLTDGFNVYYSDLDEMYHIDDYNGSSTTVRIPYYYDDGTHGDHKIIIDKIAVDEVYVSKLKDANIKELIVGEGYEYIPKNMFLGLENLEELVIESDIRSIEENAFYGCKNLSKATLSENLGKIGFYAFASCNFKEIRLPYYLKTLDVGAFSDNIELSKVTFNNNIEVIGDNSLNNTSLTTIRIPQSVKYFGFQGRLDKLVEFDCRSAIYEFENDCLIDVEHNALVKALNNAVIPDGIIYLEPYAFAYLDYSTADAFIVPESVKYIGFSAFQDTIFKSFTLNSKVEKIDESAFNGTIIDGAEDLVFEIPESVKSIGPKAFSNFTCKEIIIPKNVTTLGYKVFEDSLIEKISIYKSTIISDGCDSYWDFGIDLDYTTINIIEDDE